MYRYKQNKMPDAGNKDFFITEKLLGSSLDGANIYMNIKIRKSLSLSLSLSRYIIKNNNFYISMNFKLFVSQFQI